MGFLWMDFRNAWRLALRTPGVTLTILILLALGTGGVTTVFNPIYSLIFANPPFPQPDRLVRVGGNIPLFDRNLNDFIENNTLEYLFSNLTSYIPNPGTTVVVSDTGRPKYVRAADVGENFFETLGVQPLYGYDFKHIDFDQYRLVVVISNRFWRNEMMSTNDAIGKVIQVGRSIVPIVGIMPDYFDFPAGIDIWTCGGTGGGSIIGSSRQFLGRLQPGISIEQASRELEVAKFEYRSGLMSNDGVVLQPLNVVFYGDRQDLLLTIGATSILFLLLVCSGVMSIFVMRGMRRKSEMAIRQVSGATRRMLVFQLLRETLPLVVVGTLVGFWISEVADTWLQAQFPMLKGGEVVVPVKITFFVALVFVISIIGGLTPALYASDIDLNTHLKSGSNFKRRFIPFSLQELLMGVQLGLALALLIGTGLLIRSMMSKVDFPVGWTPQSVTVVDIRFPHDSSSFSFDGITRRVFLAQEFQRQLETMPEVAAAGVLYPIPFSDEAVDLSQSLLTLYKNLSTSPLSTAYQQNEAVRGIATGRASIEAFNLLEIPLVAGRFFNSEDVDNSMKFRRGAIAGINPGVSSVAIINHSLAKQFWPEESAIGKTIYDSYQNPYEIVGVVRDFYQVTGSRNFIPILYYPAENIDTNQKFMVKLHSDSLMQSFRQRLSTLDTGLFNINVQSLGTFVSDSTADMRLLLQLLSSFAVMGIIVAGSGVYATTAVMAVSRNREMGIRMAMGAQIWDILPFALWRGMRTILIGLPAGLFLAWILSRMLSSFIFQLNANDQLVWISSCALLIGTVTIAALIPALRAIRINPADVLRNE